MKRTHAVLVALTMGMVSLAHAEMQENVNDAPENPLATPWSRPQPTYRFIDPGLPALDGDGVSAAISNVIYLNNCKPNGCPVTPGNNDSRTNRSTIPRQPSTVQPFAYSDQVWNQVVECVRHTYAPFGVNIVTERPASGEYHMAIVAGVPQNVQMQQGVGGVSPFSCGYIPNAISFSFSNVYGPDVDDICWTVAQETAHSWGLDHKFDNRDPMTYLSSGPSRKTFQDEAGPCGEFSARSCMCGGSTMNSYQKILATFGSSTPTPPTVRFDAPMADARVDAGFPIRVTPMDDTGITRVELRINNMLIGQPLTRAPWVWNAPMTLGQGRHTLEVTAYDIAGTPGKGSIHVTLGAACDGSDDCPDGDVCVDSRCVVGPGSPGGLGEPCTEHEECKSGQCATDVDGNAYCIEACTPGARGCPSGFGCLEAGGGGVCWPGVDDGGGCNVGGDAGGLALLGIGLGAMLVARRRRD